MLVAMLVLKRLYLHSIHNVLRLKCVVAHALAAFTIQHLSLHRMDVHDHLTLQCSSHSEA